MKKILLGLTLLASMSSFAVEKSGITIIQGNYNAIGSTDDCRDKVFVSFDSDTGSVNLVVDSTGKNWNPCSIRRLHTASNANITFEKKSTNKYIFSDGESNENYGCTTKLTVFSEGQINVKYCVRRTGFGVQGGRSQVINRTYVRD